MQDAATPTLLPELDVSAWQPLADRLRPRRVEDFFGQSHLLASGRPLRQALESGMLHSMIFWGPPAPARPRSRD